MDEYAASGVTVATASGANLAIAALWNPSTTRSLLVRQITSLKVDASGSAQAVNLRRISARGTPGSTVTPTIVNDHERALAPVSGALLDLASYSVQPTIEALNLNSIWTNDAVGSGFQMQFPLGLRVDAGAGICLMTSVASIHGVARVTMYWEE